MNRQQENDGLGLQVALGIFGFFLAGGLSLAGGNSMTTSLLRGGMGMIGLFALGYGLKFAWKTLVHSAPQTDSADGLADGQEAERNEADEQVRGTHVDIVLPEEGPADGEFVPLSQSVKKEQSLSDEDARKLADALRHLNE